MDFPEDPLEVILVRPGWIMGLELSDIADVPDMFADTVLVPVDDAYLVAGARLQEVDGLKHRAVRVAPATRVVDLAWPRITVVMPEHVDDVVGVKVVTDLLPLVPEHLVGQTGDGTPGQVGKEAVHLGRRVPWTGDAPAAKAHRPHAKVATVLLDEDIGGQLGSPEKGMLRLVEGHALIDAMLAIKVLGRNLPAAFKLD